MLKYNDAAWLSGEKGAATTVFVVGLTCDRSAYKVEDSSGCTKLVPVALIPDTALMSRRRVSSPLPLVCVNGTDWMDWCDSCLSERGPK
jgi:hypothetical protein